MTTQTRRYRIEHCVDDDGEPDGWEVGIYEYGKWIGSCCYDTGAEAIAAYNSLEAGGNA